MAELTGMSEDVKGLHVEIKGEPITFGRVKENTIVLKNPTVSSRHCRITCEGKRYTLQDLGSTNGTRVNSRDIQKTVLRPKDIVQVGSVEFLFDAEDAEYEPVQHDSIMSTHVHEEVGEAAAPPSNFENVSPFGAKKESKGMWIAVIAILFLIALGGVIWVLIKLMGAA